MGGLLGGIKVNLNIGGTQNNDTQSLVLSDTKATTAPMVLSRGYSSPRDDDDDGGTRKEWQWLLSRDNNTESRHVNVPKFGILQQHEHQPKVIVVIGLPGTGKTTQCRKLVKKFPQLYAHLSLGDHLRHLATTETSEDAQTILNAMQQNNSAPFELVIPIVEEFLQRTHELKKIVILDGFPRDLTQVYWLLANTNVVTCLHFDVDKEVCVERISNRWVNPDTNEIASKQVKGFSRRMGDDNPIFIAQRIATFEDFLPRIQFILQEHLQMIDGRGDIREVEKAVATKLAAPTLSRNSFCLTCNRRLALCVNMPCGHRTSCSFCLQLQKVNNTHGKKRTKKTCSDCQEKITHVVELDFYGKKQPMDTTDRTDKCMDDDSDHDKSDDDEDDAEKKQEGEENDDVIQTIDMYVGCYDDVQKKCDCDVMSVAVKLTLPDRQKELQHKLIWLLDLSTSMNEILAWEDDDGKMHQDLTKLEYMKLAMESVIESLHEHQQLAIVTFHTYAQVVFSLQPMTPQAKAIAIHCVKNLKTGGSTAISRGLDMVADRFLTHDSELTSILLFSDGEPDPSDPWEQSINTIMCKYPSAHVCTFGLGIKIDRSLTMIARLGNGVFTYIPDVQTMAGCIAAAMGNISAMCVQCATLQIDTKNGVTFTDGTFKKWPEEAKKMTTRGKQESLHLRWGPLFAGQVTILFNINVPRPFRHKELLQLYLKDEQNNVVANKSVSEFHFVQDAALLQANECLIDSMWACMRNPTSAETSMPMLAANLRYMTPMHPFIEFLAQAVEENEKLQICGRIKKAFKTKQQTTWGKPYLDSLFSALFKQRRVNSFAKEQLRFGGMLATAKSLQVTKNHSELQAHVSVPVIPNAPSSATTAIYQRNLAPPPYPTTVAPMDIKDSTIPVATPAKPLAVMPPAPKPNNYYQCNRGGCFAGDVKVKTQNRGVLWVKNIRPGDCVWTGMDFAEVQTFIKIVGQFQVVGHRSTAFITPTHPVIADSYIGPLQHIKVHKFVQEVYCFLLAESHFIELEGVSCITWGHEFSNVFAHAFYGNRQRVNRVLEHVATRKEDGVYVISKQQMDIAKRCL